MNILGRTEHQKVSKFGYLNKHENNTENLLEGMTDKRNFFEVYKKVVANKESNGMRLDYQYWTVG